MLGSILGDIAGSTYEFVENKRLDVPLFPEGSNFTDDTIMTVATADAILGDGDYTAAYRRWGIRYPDPMGGYGVRFREWLETPGAKAYGSWGNGSAMRVAPIGWAFDTLEQTKAEARRSAEVTHNHPEGIKGAEATAVAIWLARHGSSKDEIRQVISETYGYDLTRTCDEIRPTYRFNESCQETVPQAFAAFFDSTDFENALRLAVSLGGDADTIACITGGVAEAFYRKIPHQLRMSADRLLAGEPLKPVATAFVARYCG